MHIHDIYMMGRCTDSHLVYRSSSKYLKLMTQGQPRSGMRARMQESFWCWVEQFTSEKPTASKRQTAPTTSRKPECHGPRTPSVGWADFAEATHCPKTTAYLPPNTANLFSTVK